MMHRFTAAPPAHCLSLDALSGDQILALLKDANVWQALWHQGRLPPVLSKHRVGLWFQGAGFRNRVAFELGAQALGAQTLHLPGELGVQEPLEDVADYLANWLTMLVVRCARHTDLVALAAGCRIPVINARTDRSHPCEVLGDLHFIGGRLPLEGLRVVWLGNASNVGRTWLELARRLPIRLSFVCPVGHAPDEAEWRSLTQGALCEVKRVTAWQEVIGSADVLLTDCWPAARDAEHAERIRRDFLPQQVSVEMLRRLPDRALFLPCPPVTRGQEVSAEAMSCGRSLSHLAKDSLLHAQNAVLAMLS